MGEPVKLVQPEPNASLIENLEALLAQARAGEFIGLVGVKLRAGRNFQTFRYGACSDLELCGALVFAQHDLIVGNSPD